ncbi:hybrid sensor histidine kinase/response regulator [Mangrovihabitans endophyticus]|uniref:histidine kinase n=1 Tax=Mangrovihabitans endophyticus TaxID=1751298 RepID=A0A8J3BYR1_9ACTN|nr:response regulator [Mangrovihabitans endophyticus]GGK90338.1 hypothetical protein GCM10012284_25320 [Mangrovihabitans endophyticus]
MTVKWSEFILFAAEFTFAALFVRALLGYLRRRDPLQRDITLVFAPCTVLFVVDLADGFTGDRPAWAELTVRCALLAQPYLTIRLAARLRHVPLWAQLVAIAAYLVAAVAVLVAGLPLPQPVLVLTTAGFLAAEAVAAVLLVGKARTRIGANRARLYIAAGSAIAFGGFIVLLKVASRAETGETWEMASRLLGLLSGIGYLIAFVPPVWLQWTFTASAAQSVTERLLRAPADSPEQVWQTYAEIMRVQTGADAVAVLMPRPDGLLTPTAYAGPPIDQPEELTFADLTALIRARRPTRLREGSPALVEHYGDDLRDDFVTVVSMPVPPDTEGAVLLFNQHRTLFSDDDLRLLVALGGQAGVLAERQSILTAQRQLATELSASVEALTQANHAKSTFLANMSHELRTPLNAIIGFSDLMRQEEPDGDRRLVPADWVDHIHSSGRHLLGLINDILDLAKVEAGRLELRLVALRVDTAIEELLPGLEPLVARKNITVSTELPQASAHVDPVRFRQIAENLLSNAIKFTPAGGAIAVTVRPSADMVSLTVTDTGVGIAPEDQERVFEEFQQVGDDEGRQAGTGLGLALTKRLVEAHGGDITLVSQLGQGSAFTVRLPAARPAPPPVEAATADDEGPSPRRVLLIEDDAQAAELLRTQLGAAGYRVEIAPDGETGLGRATANPPDAIVLDVTLPGIDGWEVIRRLKSDPGLVGIPVFFVTIVDERQAGLALGAADYFVKPVDQGDLLRALARCLGDHKPPRVLVVDPDDAVRAAIERGLRAGGADVVACASGADGIALSRSNTFDLIVCDVQSPQADGLGLLAAIEQDPATRHIPVLGLHAGDGHVPAPLIATALAGGVMAEAMVPPAAVPGTAPETEPRKDNL